MHFKRTLMIACTAGSLLTAGSLFAAGTQTKAMQTKAATTTTTTTTTTTAAVKSDVPAGLAKQAKISLDTARATALAKVHNGTVRSEELEKEHGKLIYSFDMKTKQPGVTEVNIDAMNGKIIAVQHETPAKESAEKKQEAKEKSAVKH